jgi:hypothetical protein
MIDVVYIAISIAMVIFWLSMSTDDDDDLGGGKMIPAYQQAER